MKNEYKFAKAQPEDEWKIPLVKELTDINQGVFFVPDDDNGQFSAEELTEILEYVTTIWTFRQLIHLNIVCKHVNK